MSDPDLDALYQVPLRDFIAARNALAKARGADGALIKAREKPSLPAWAVNQLYWTARDVWDTLIDTSQAMRDAHVAVIAGRTADVAGAEAAHNSARRTAADTALGLLTAAGEKTTPATLDAIAETLQALPAPDVEPGRLTRALKPLGFSALMALGIPTAERPANAADAGTSPAEAARHRRALKTAQAALRRAEAAEVEADAALGAARSRLVFAEKQRVDAEEDVRRRTAALEQAVQARRDAAEQVERLR